MGFNIEEKLVIPKRSDCVSELWAGLIRILKTNEVLGMYRALVDVGSLCAEGASLNQLYRKALTRGYI